VGSYPEHRLHRVRRTATIRGAFQEVRLHPSDLIWPIFVSEQSDTRQAIASLEGQYVYPLHEVVSVVRDAMQKGVRAVILFGKPQEKDAEGSEASDEHGCVQEAIRALKQNFGDELFVLADVCMCQYTDHGHCGIIKDQSIDNDATVGHLADIALSYAQAGVDWVAPSDMMDGRVTAIRAALDEHEFEHVGIMSYSVKFASAFYGPFRDAADSTPSFGDRRSYQMQPANGREALLEAAQDEEEGADALMVKPAGPYLDVLWQLRQDTDLPLAAYQVSGEYASICAAAANGWLDRKGALLESVLSIKRAGADLIITYAAPELAQWLRSDAS
jgi:porphobilinogen synthase